MEYSVSVIIPNRNGASTIKDCLEAVCSSHHDSFEVIVVDDCSEDNSIEITRRYPCRLIEFTRHKGAAAARNEGARHARGRILFFIDADCVIFRKTLMQVEQSCLTKGKEYIIGGTYTCKPFDRGFYSLFQSVFIHHSELKIQTNPDYIATHAMAVFYETFWKSDGFAKNFTLPILEDVEFSHRLQRQGFRLLIDPELQVRHIFNFSFVKSIKNAFRKSQYWTMYSITNQDLCKDSGCASYELKVNVFSLLAALFFIFLQIAYPDVFPSFLVAIPILLNCVVSRHLLTRYYRTGGGKIVLMAAAYYMLVYSTAVGCGGIAGLFRYFVRRQKDFVFTRTLLHQSDN